MLNKYIDSVGRENIESFIINVFNYYNGKINIFNPAVLEIEWANRYGDPRGGTTSNPNIVTIFPRVSARMMSNDGITDPYWLYYNLLMCIIHELHHVDQEINFIRLSYDEAYKSYIEGSVEVETMMYIANHQQEIMENFGLCDRINYNNYYPLYGALYEPGRLYKRRNYLTHMQNILRDMLYLETHPIIDVFTEKFLMLNTTIEMQINNIRFVLKDNELCIPIEQLNYILTQQFFRYILRSSIKADWYESDTHRYKYLIRFTTACSNIIGRAVNTIPPDMFLYRKDVEE